MRPGEVLAERFDILATAGAGAMGVVYRAHDRHTGQDVAVKVMHPGEDGQAARFTREARALAAIVHPAVVRYVAHGTTEIGEPYLVMEWIDGELLSKRLGRGTLGVADAVAIARRIAEALGAAHARHVVHRDLKPGNVVLVGGRLDQVKIIDFGLVRLGEFDTQLTMQGMLVGTPAYMSPEQARGASDVDARSDVYSLGCLMYRALAGRTPSVAEDVRALLAKIALEPPPPLARLRPEVPPALDTLVTRMLSKVAAERPADGSVVATELESIDVDADGDRTIEVHADSESRGGLTGSERVIVSVAMALPPDGAASVDTRLGTELAAGGAEIVPLADGALLLAMRGAGGAGEQAASAARAAIHLRARLPESPIVLATGRGMRGERVPVGEAIERAAELLRADAADSSGPPRPIRIDGVTAGLLDARFDVRDRGGSLTLVGERETIEGTRTLLGRPTACVGRERELGVLAGLFEECAAEPVARVVLATAPAGVGKSRLRYEFLRQIDARGRHARVLLGGGDPMRAGSPFGLIARAVRRWAGTRDGEPLEAQQRTLVHAVESVVRVDPQRVTRFLGEACGVSFPDEQDPQLRAARRDPLLMGDRVRRAWKELVGALCDTAPVILVLEDLHWGDLPSVQLVDSILRELADRPLLVLALARPEVDDAFPRLWAERDVQRLTLAPLTRRASERLVRDVLGPDVGEDTVGRIATLGAGNAFYLEELIRAVSQGAGEKLPETVLAMVEARLETLEPEARRLLRAASVFGEAFWEGGVSALLRGGDRDGSADERHVDVRGWLKALVSRELVTARGDARFPGEREFGFRHALLREAAYARLTDEDRPRGHLLAGAWLEQAGETEAIALAEHFEKAGARARAGAAYTRAADQAFAASDFTATIARVDRALACDPPEPSRGPLHLLRAEARHWLGDAVGTVDDAMRARELLDPTRPIWWRAVGVLILSLGGAGRREECAEWARRLIEAWPARPDLQEAVGGACRSALSLLAVGLVDLSEVLAELAAKAVAESGAALDSEVAAQLHRVTGFRAVYRGSLGVFAREFKAAADAFDVIGDARRACVERANHGWALVQLGRPDEGERVMAMALDTALRIGSTKVIASVDHNLGVVFLRRRDYVRARDLEQTAARTFEAHGDKRLEGSSRLYLGLAHLGCGDVEIAEREARRAVEVLERVPPARAHALAALAAVQLARGDAPGALASAREASALLEEMVGIEEGEEFVRLVHAEALHAVGDRAGAMRAIEAARDRLMHRAESIDVPAWRASFLEGVPDNARTLELARAWGGAGASAGPRG